MRYVVIGAGAVGGTVGGRLHQAGRSVVLVARGAHLERLRADGLHLVTPDGDARLDVPAVAGPDELTLTPDDVLVIATKSQHTVDALTTWAWAPVDTGDGTRPAGRALPLLCAQNGVSNEPAALRWFDRVVGAAVWLPSGMPEAGVVVAPSAPLSGMLHLGWYPPGPDPIGPNPTGPNPPGLLATVAADLDASHLGARVQADVMAWKRAKLLSNLGNAFDALLPADGGWQPFQRQARAEGRAVLDAAGLAVTPPEQERAARGDLVTPRELPGQVRAGGSTYQSLERRADSLEVDWLNGEVVRLGRRHGVPTPVNAALQELAAAAVREGATPRAFPLARLEALLAG